MVDDVYRPEPAPHTMVFDAGLAAPLAQMVMLLLPFRASTSSTVSATAVAPTGTPLLFTVQSRVRGVVLSLVFGPCDGLVPGRESYTRAGAGSTWNAPAADD